MPPPQGFDPLPNQRVPLCTISKYPFLMMDPKIFLKVPLAPICTNFEGEVKIFQKLLKNAFLASFWKFLPAAQKIWPKQGFLVLWDSSKNQFGRPKTKSSKFSQYFENPLSLEKILDPPLFLQKLSFSIFAQNSLCS